MSGSVVPGPGTRPSSATGPVVTGTLSPFAEKRGGGWIAPLGLVASVAVHVGLAILLALQPEKLAHAAQWVEMSVTRPEPPPPPPPTPPPPPQPKPKPKPEPVKFEDIKPPETAPPPDAPPSRRVVKMHGLNANSFAPNSASGLTVRTGTTVATKATNETMTLDEAAQSRSYASVTTPPRVKLRAQMEVPKEAQEAEVEGEVKVLLDIGADGAVAAVRVLTDLGFGTGEACAEAWKRSRFTPGKQDGNPVAVTGLPQLCQVVALQ